MDWNEDKLKEAAHKLALEHDPHVKRISTNALWKRIESDIEQVRAFVKELHEHRSACAQPAEEWLLDHSEFLEAEVLGIREEISRIHATPLPTVGKSDQLRVSSICEAYLEHTDGLLDEETFTVYLASYQEVSVLTIAEAWSIPLFMKMELIRRLASIMKPVKERRSICELVERMLSGNSDCRTNAGALKASASGLGPLSSATRWRFQAPLCIRYGARPLADDVCGVYGG